jgi:SAM-dependent methyltransferase
MTAWTRKAVLREIYREFYEIINSYLRRDINGEILELGSGIGRIKEVIPECICSDTEKNMWVDREENAYKLSFRNSSVSNIILFDVFHHLEFPGDALREFHRVLANSGRVLLFEPCISLLGMVVYGLFHDEKIGLNENISWHSTPEPRSHEYAYYANQGNASRIFIGKGYSQLLNGWDVVKLERMSAISYIASGGYSGPQLYPDSCYQFMRKIDRICDHFPRLFSTRMLVVLEKAG